MSVNGRAEMMAIMSVQFGRCNFDGKPVAPEDLEEVRPVLAPYGPDGEGYICKDNFAILYRALQTTKESRREQQPFTSASGTVITWDGRLDNREELIEQLGSQLSRESTDLEIVSAAYERWGTQSFAKVIGDWAISIWNPRERSLILAKDFVGTRHLYYSVAKNQVTWCTILDPLVLFAGHWFKLNEEYVAGWLALFPAPHLTPYVGIHSVPPSTFVCLTSGEQRISKYWDFNPACQVRYSNDGEYEEHFRCVFAQSVRRRLRSDTPIVAELSGGMDSSSIVCLADDILASDRANAERLDTISYYDDSDPNWNERPYLETVERRRGREGVHVNIGSQNTIAFEPDHLQFVASPAGALGRDEAANLTSECLARRGTRVLLSGIGGDEVTGGVPTPVPELADLLVTMQVQRLARQLKSWALAQRRPWHYILSEAVSEFVPLAKLSTNLHPAPWLSPEFISRHRPALCGYARRLKFWGALPSFQENLRALDSLRRQIGIMAPSAHAPQEPRYPYLDRDLLEFLYSVPREQIVRPGQRRSLMRRALKGIVPDKVLMRRRKAYVTRQPVHLVTERLSELVAIAQSSTSTRIEWIDSEALVKSMSAVQAGDFKDYLPLIRTILFEVWFRRAVFHSRLESTPKIKAHRERKRFSSNELEIREKGG
jgi:asparagine synthase (glutamine-hydrolysing)